MKTRTARSSTRHSTWNGRRSCRPDPASPWTRRCKDPHRSPSWAPIASQSRLSATGRRCSSSPMPGQADGRRASTAGRRPCSGPTCCLEPSPSRRDDTRSSSATVRRSCVRVSRSRASGSERCWRLRPPPGTGAASAGGSRPQAAWYPRSRLEPPGPEGRGHGRVGVPRQPRRRSAAGAGRRGRRPAQDRVRPRRRQRCGTFAGRCSPLARDPPGRPCGRHRGQSRQPRIVLLREPDDGGAAPRGVPAALCGQGRDDRDHLFLPQVHTRPVPRGGGLERLPGGDERSLRPRQEDAPRPGTGLPPAVRHERRPPAAGKPVRPAGQLRPRLFPRDPGTHQEVPGRPRRRRGRGRGVGHWQGLAGVPVRRGRCARDRDGRGRVRRHRAREPGRRLRDPDPRPGRADRAAHGLRWRDPLGRDQARRPATALPRHVARRAPFRLPRRHRLRGRAEAHDRLVPGRAERGPGMTAALLDDVTRFYEEKHESLERARQARRYYYDYLTRVLQARVPPGMRVLEIGCGTGQALAALQPARGVGIDLSARAVAHARQLHQGMNLHFIEGDGGDPAILKEAGGPFDAVILCNVVTQLHDVQAAFEALHDVCHPRTRLLIYSYSRVWQPVLRLAEWLGLKHEPPPEAWLPSEEVAHMLHLADFEIVRWDYQLVFPVGVPFLSDLANRYLGRLPLIEWLSLMYGAAARPAPHRSPGRRTSTPSVSVVIPCRNEAGHIEPLLRRLPELPANSEFLFVEGNSSDDTEAVLRQAIARNPERPLRLLKQTGRGKGDAVRLGFSKARGEVLLILDADMGVAPEDVPKFVGALVRGKGEFVNGSRLVYPMEGRAMRFLNLLANKFFALLFSWLLGQQVRDTLCGTKALYREDYERIAANRAYFGDFDPFGDFDLLFGAARLNLRIADLAVRYHERRYGETNISRFSHGWLLLRMSRFAARKLKFL